jgi:hypothetical protein
MFKIYEKNESFGVLTIMNKKNIVMLLYFINNSLGMGFKSPYKLAD